LWTSCCGATEDRDISIEDEQTLSSGLKCHAENPLDRCILAAFGSRLRPGQQVAILSHQ